MPFRGLRFEAHGLREAPRAFRAILGLRAFQIHYIELPLFFIFFKIIGIKRHL